MSKDRNYLYPDAPDWDLRFLNNRASALGADTPAAYLAATGRPMVEDSEHYPFREGDPRAGLIPTVFVDECQTLRFDIADKGMFGRVKRIIRTAQVERAAIDMLHHLDRLTLSAHGNADGSMSMTVKSGEWGHLRDLVIRTRALLGED